MSEQLYNSGEQKYLEGYADDLTAENIEQWTSKENLEKRISRIVDGFEVISSIDGNEDPKRKREVSYVRAFKEAKYPIHLHEKSEGLFLIIKGKGVLLPEKLPVKAGDVIEVSKGSLHGFEIIEEDPLEFVSVQVPPIKDPNTGEEDLKYKDEKSTDVF